MVQECSSKHSGMGTARMKWNKEPEDEGKKRRESMERSIYIVKFVWKKEVIMACHE